MSNKTCIVMGNGPSLKNVPRDFLNMYPTFGCNNVFEKYIPTYYVFVDPSKERFEYLKPLINMANSIKFIDRAYAHEISECTPLETIHKPGFSSNSSSSFIYAYFSSVTVMLQLAYQMNFYTVLLVGVDHRYIERGKRMFHPASEDVNHYTQNYYSNDAKWMAPDLDKLTNWLITAKEIFEQQGKKIINLTPDSALNVFDKDSIENWVVSQ